FFTLYLLQKYKNSSRPMSTRPKRSDTTLIETMTRLEQWSVVVRPNDTQWSVQDHSDTVVCVRPLVHTVDCDRTTTGTYSGLWSYDHSGTHSGLWSYDHWCIQWLWWYDHSGTHSGLWSYDHWYI
ncbi:hypothetical protein OTU49_014870, partial [Cherax quadricarinatus]